MTGGKSGTRDNPMGVPKRPVVRSGMSEEEKKAILSELPQVRHEQDSVAQTAPCQKGLIHRRSHEANHSESKKDGSIG